jgi:hypothetical protein
MTHRHSLLILLLLVPAPLLGQGPGSKFGAIVGGATLSDLYGFTNTDSRWGGTAGILLGVNTWRTAVTLEGNWVQKGGGDTRLDYIEVPLTFGPVVQGSGGNTRVRLYGGVSVAFNLSCSSLGFECNDVQSTEWGLPVGLQFGQTTGSGTFFGADIRYSFALNDAFEVGESYNRTWQFRLMVGKRFGQP